MIKLFSSDIQTVKASLINQLFREHSGNPKVAKLQQDIVETPICWAGRMSSVNNKATITYTNKKYVCRT